jgi:VanZ family protein
MIENRLPRKAHSFWRLSPATRRVLVVAAIGLYWLLLFVLTHLPGDPRPEPPEGVIPHLDKLAHSAAFAGLAFLACVGASTFRPVTPQVLGSVAAALALYAAVDEQTQGWVPFRVPDFRDWVADMLGMLVGLCAFLLACRLASRSARAATTPVRKSQP